MNEVDPRFGQPRHTDDPSSELSHASDEIFNEWTRGIKKTFSSLYNISEKFSDNTSAFMTCAFGSESALEHSKEVERSANQAITNGNNEGAKHLLKRDLAYSMWTLGFDNTQTQAIKSQLDQLENPRQNQVENPPLNQADKTPQTSAQQASSATRGIAGLEAGAPGVSSFAELFKHL
jgi:hypothetical protein